MKAGAWVAVGVVIFALGCGAPQRETRSPKTLTLLPLGKVDPSLLQSIHARLESSLPVKVTIAKSVELPKEAYTKPRNRYRADKLLDWLAKQDRFDIVLGVTAKDISTTHRNQQDWGVFGLGYCPGRAAVISSFRLHKKGGVAPDERLRRIAVHEVGHTLGLNHCPNKCIMADAQGRIQSVDQHTSFCDSCRSRIFR